MASGKATHNADKTSVVRLGLRDLVNKHSRTVLWVIGHVHLYKTIVPVNPTFLSVLFWPIEGHFG